MYPENVKRSTNVPGYLNMTAGVARLAGGGGVWGGGVCRTGCAHPHPV